MKCGLGMLSDYLSVQSTCRTDDLTCPVTQWISVCVNELGTARTGEEGPVTTAMCSTHNCLSFRSFDVGLSHLASDLSQRKPRLKACHSVDIFRRGNVLMVKAAGI